MRGSFVRFWRLMGMTNLYSDPEFVHAIARIMLEFNLAQLESAGRSRGNAAAIDEVVAFPPETL